MDARSPRARKPIVYPPSAVLFDFDGVLADTANIHVAAWERTFGAMGWNIDPEICAKAASVDDRLFLTEIFARRGIADGDVTGWLKRKQKLTVSMLEFAPRLCPGVRELIDRLQGCTQLGVVTTTWRENVEAVLRAAGLESAFGVIVSKEDVKYAKPDPTGYKLAVKRLKVHPKRAIAIEDSVVGHMAAQLAGVRYLIVHQGSPPAGWVGYAPYLPDLTDADMVMETLRNLVPFPYKPDELIPMPGQRRRRRT